jgi:uncharacterized membrane protein
MSTLKSETDRAEINAGGSYTLMACACCVALGTLAPVALYQLKLLPHLADPPSLLFDSDYITSSKAARPFGVPDSILGLTSFATTLGLILTARHHEPAKQLLGAKLLVDAGAAAFNLTRQVVSFRRLCSWCTATALSVGFMAYAGRKTIAASAFRRRNTFTPPQSAAHAAQECSR